MNKNLVKFIGLLAITFSMCGCNDEPSFEGCHHIDHNADNICDTCNVTLEENPQFYGYIYSNLTKNRPTSGTAEVDIYSFNDFHGQVFKKGYYAGLTNFASFMKSRTDQPNTLFIDSGDTWQGSLESNSNFGKLINDVFCYARCSARTIGNHDFDWGVEQLLQNTNLSYDGYTIPTIGANISAFDWDNREIKDRRYDIAKDYIIYELENGLRVGIVGTIGEAQLTSISTNLVKDIFFTDQLKKIREVSNYLRTTKQCDIIISSEHSGYNDYVDYYLGYNSPLTGKKYADYVLNGHKHSTACYHENDIYYTQSSSNGEDLFYTKLKFDFSTKKVSYCNEPQYLNAGDIENFVDEIGVNQKIKEMVDTSLQETNIVGNEVLNNNVTGGFVASGSYANLMAEAIYNECVNENIEVDFAITNTARASLNNYYKTTITYSELYNAFPFDNRIYIIKVSNIDAIRQIGYYSGGLYNVNCISTISTSKTYRIAILDYLAFHTDVRREYDYFPGAVEITYLKKNGQTYTYREVLADYLRNSKKAFNADDYSNNQERFTTPSFSYYD